LPARPRRHVPPRRPDLLRRRRFAAVCRAEAPRAARLCQLREAAGEDARADLLHAHRQGPGRTPPLDRRAARARTDPERSGAQAPRGRRPRERRAAPPGAARAAGRARGAAGEARRGTGAAGGAAAPEAVPAPRPRARQPPPPGPARVAGRRRERTEERIEMTTHRLERTYPTTPEAIWELWTT